MTSATRVHVGKTSAKQALSSSQLEQLRAALESKKAQLLRAHEDREEQAAEADADAGDAADVAERVIEDRQRATFDEHDWALLGEVEHALVKLGAGTYGPSEISGLPIAFARLLAVPWTRYRADEASHLEHDAAPASRR